PCSVNLPKGAHRLAVAELDGDPVPVKEAVMIDGSATLEAHYSSLWGVRLTGRIIELGALVAGLALAIDCGAHQASQPAGVETGFPKQLLIGGAIVLGGGLIGSILTGVDDKVTLRPIP